MSHSSICPERMFACPSSGPFSPTCSRIHYGINAGSDGKRCGFASAVGGPEMKITRIKRPSARAGFFDVSIWKTYSPDPGAIERAQMVMSATTGTGSWRIPEKWGQTSAFADGHSVLMKYPVIPENFWYNSTLGYFWSRLRTIDEWRFFSDESEILFHSFCPCHTGGVRSAEEIPEGPAREDEWGFHPATGEVCEVTPAPFVWKDQTGAVSYELQYARTGDFQNAQTVSKLRWNVYCPSREMESGRWFWRVGLRGRTDGNRTGAPSAGLKFHPTRFPIRNRNSGNCFRAFRRNIPGSSSVRNSFRSSAGWLRGN